MTKESVVVAAHRQGLNWATALVFAIIHVGAIAALFMFSWKALAISVAFYYVCTGLGISMGYHRLHTHRSFRVPIWLEYFFALCGDPTVWNKEDTVSDLPPLVNAPTAEPTRKTKAVAIGGGSATALSVIIGWLLGKMGLEVPAEVQVAFVSVILTVVAYLTRDRAQS